MNPVPLFLIIVTLPLLLGGCGEKESVGKVQPVEEKVLEVKEEVKTEESVAETKPELEGVNIKESKVSDGIRYLKDSDTPYTGKVFTLFGNGQKLSEGNWKDGKKEGLSVVWHENGQKKLEGNYKDGEMYGLWTLRHENGQKAEERNYKDGEVVKGSAKYWNSKGEPVDSEEEAKAE